MAQICFSKRELCLLRSEALASLQKLKFCLLQFFKRGFSVRGSYVRILDQATTKADIITLQLIENLNRENLDPIDEATNAYLEFFRAKVGNTNVEEIISNIMNYERDPGRVKEAFTANFAVNAKITGK